MLVMRTALLVSASLVALSTGMAGVTFAPVIAKPCKSLVSGAAQKESDRFFKSAMAKKRIGDEEAVLLDLAQSLRLKPGRHDALYEQAQAYTILNRLPEARAKAEACISINPNWAEAHSLLGWIHDLQGDIQKAEKETNFALKLGPKSLMVLADSVYFNLKRGKYQDALVHAEKLIQYYPNGCQGWALAGYCLSFQHENERALLSADVAVKIEPNSSWTHNIKAVVLEKQERFKEALREAELVWQMGDRRACSALKIGRLAYLTARTGEATSWFEKAIELDAEYAYEEITTFLRFRDAHMAMSYVERGILRFPNNAKLHHRRSTIFCHTNRADLGIADSDMACKLEPANSYYAAHAGTARYLSGDRIGGIAGFEKGIALAPGLQYRGVVSFLIDQRDPLALGFSNRSIAAFSKRADLYFERARLHSWNNNWKAALRDAEKALALDPKVDTYAHEIRVNALLNLKKNDLALAAMEDYEKLAALPLRLMDFKAKLLVNQGNYLDAKATLDRAVSLYPTSYRYLLRSLSNRHLGFYDDAITDARSAMSLDKSWTARGLRESYMAHLKQGNLLAASSEFLASLVAVFTPGVKP